MTDCRFQGMSLLSPVEERLENFTVLFIEVFDAYDGVPACLAVVKDCSKLALKPVFACQKSVECFMKHLGCHDLAQKPLV